MSPRRSLSRLLPAASLLLLGLAVPGPVRADGISPVGLRSPRGVEEPVGSPPGPVSIPQEDPTGDDDEAAPVERPAEPGDRPRIAVVGSIGHAVEINGSERVDPLTVMVRYSRPLGGRFLGGRPAWGVEFGLFRFDQEPEALGFGSHLLYEHRFAPEAAVQPIVRLGAGALYTDEEVPRGETSHNFSVFVEAGLEAKLGPAVWLQAGYRFHHVSNADTGLRNPGINAHTGVAGLAFAF